MKKIKRKILDSDTNVIWEKLLAIFDEHGSEVTFKAMLTGIRDTKYDDLPISEVIDILTKMDKSYKFREFLEDHHVEQLTQEITCFTNNEVVKIEGLAQQIRFDEFIESLNKNPYQLSLCQNY